MSERGSFVTEYIYCRKCLEHAKAAFLSDGKFLRGVIIPSWIPGEELPIIAGKIGGTYQREELFDMEQISEELAKVICHPMRIAVLAESGERIFKVNPVPDPVSDVVGV